MEQSKLVSTIIAKFKIAYPYYFKDLTLEELAGLVSMYQEELTIYNEMTLLEAVKSIIRKSKFMPTIKEILDECESCKVYQRNIVIEKMQQAGYFKSPTEIDKVYKFFEKGIIPKWLLDDMKKYGYQDDKELIGFSQNLLLNNGGVTQ